MAATIEVPGNGPVRLPHRRFPAPNAIGAAPCGPARTSPGPARDDSVVIDLVARARDRDGRAALREAFAGLPPDGQQLIAMLTADPPVPYLEISARLGIPVGSIGPTRRRCLDRMRRHPALAALTGAEPRPPRPVLAAAS